MKLSFYGAAREVTGSAHLIETDSHRLLLDYGMNQGHRAEAAQRNQNPPFDPATVDSVVLSHAHIDHSGNLPTLVKKGFTGEVHCTPATRALIGLMLRDSAHIQEQDAQYLNQKKSRRDLPPVEPLYTMADAETALRQVVAHSYERWFQAPGARVLFQDAGHILGSAISTLELTDGGRPVRLGFSGDLGRKNTLILRDPVEVTGLDYLIVESTYGDREHPPVELSADELAAVVARTVERGGKVIIPAFAVERTQEVVYALHLKTEAGKIPRVPIYVDSPLAVNATDVYRLHLDDLREEVRQHLLAHDDPFGFGKLRFIRTVEESKALNTLPGPAVIISANGMAEAGRILHHLKHNIEDERNCVVFVGYQAQNTLGRRLIDGVKKIKIFGDEFDVRARIEIVNGFSAHADRSELLDWVKAARDRLKGVYIVHGEEQASLSFADALRALGGVQVTVPELNQTIQV